MHAKNTNLCIVCLDRIHCCIKYPSFDQNNKNNTRNCDIIAQSFFTVTQTEVVLVKKCGKEIMEGNFCHWSIKCAYSHCIENPNFWRVGKCSASTILERIYFRNTNLNTHVKTIPMRTFLFSLKKKAQTKKEANKEEKKNAIKSELKHCCRNWFWLEFDCVSWVVHSFSIFFFFYLLHRNCYFDGGFRWGIGHSEHPLWINLIAFNLNARRECIRAIYCNLSDKNAAEHANWCHMPCRRISTRCWHFFFLHNYCITPCMMVSLFPFCSKRSIHIWAPSLLATVSIFFFNALSIRFMHPDAFFVRLLLLHFLCYPVCIKA